MTTFVLFTLITAFLLIKRKDIQCYMGKHQFIKQKGYLAICSNCNLIAGQARNEERKGF